MQQTFFWRNRLERLALEQSDPKLTEGQLGLVILEHKCRALFLVILIMQFIWGIQRNKFLEQLERKSFKRNKAESRGTPDAWNPFLFSNAVSEILYVLDTSPNTQWSNMATKAFYCTWLTSPENPKINQPLNGSEGKLMELHQKLPKKITTRFSHEILIFHPNLRESFLWYG